MRSIKRGMLLPALTMILVGAWCAPGLAEETPTPQPPQPDPAQPQQAEGHGLEEIIVTAQRRSENLQKVPIAVTVLSADTLDKEGVIDVRLLASTVPGLTYTTNGNTGVPRIRGVGVAFAGAGNENSVATYVDDVYYASAPSAVLSFNNISQVSVLKGPQGTLFGRNATGGLIQITTRDPSETFSGLADVTVGNLSTYGTNLYVTGGLIENVAADLAVHFKDQIDGFGKNLFDGRDVGQSREVSLRSKLKAELGDATSAMLILDYGRSTSVTPGYQPLSGSLPLDGKPFTGGKFDIDTNMDPYSSLYQYGVSLHVKHDFGFADLVSITAYRHSDFYAGFDADAEPENFLSVVVHEPDRQFSQELRLVSDSNGPLTWQAGAFYFWARGGYIPVAIPIPLFGIVSNVNTNQTTNSAAGFGQATYKFTDSTSLTLGARLTAETKNIDGSGSTFVDNPGISLPEGPYHDSITVTRPTWRMALDHQFTSETMAYVSYNRGFKSGGFDPGAATAAVPFKPEILDAYEVGTKSEVLDRRLRINAASFYYDYHNIQLNSYSNGLNSIYNGKSAKIYGVDMDVTAAATDQLTLNLGLSLLHDRYGNFPISETAQLPTGGLVALGNESADGKRLQFTPDWQLNFGGQYEIPLSSGNVVLASDFFHSAKWYSTPENRTFQSAYNLVNASATWLFGHDERRTLQLWGRNLGNVAYADQVVIEVPVADYRALAPGRTFGVTLSTKF
jgi:iron complex outermembrane receptor protein